MEMVKVCEQVESPEKCVKCLYFLLSYWSGAGLPVSALESGILARGPLKREFCSSLLSAEKLFDRQRGAHDAKNGPFFSGKFLWEVAQKTCTEDLQRKVAHKSWTKIRRAILGGNSSRTWSRKIVVGSSDLRRAGRGPLAVFSCGHHFTNKEFEERVLPSLEKALETLPRQLPLTTALLLSSYRPSEAFHLGCPVCAYNAIAAKFAKPALAPRQFCNLAS